LIAVPLIVAGLAANANAHTTVRVDHHPFGELPMPGMFSFFATAHLAAATIGLLAYVLATRIGRQRRHPSAAIAWVLAMVAFPYAGVPLFLLFGTRKMVRPVHGPGLPGLGAGTGASSAPPWARQLTAGLSLPAACANRRVVLLEDGPAALDALLALIAGAQERLDLCTFVFADDSVGRRVADALLASATRGVRVRVLLDAIGSQRTPRGLRRRLVAGGIALRWFMPMLHNPVRGRSNLRNHRKLAIADGRRLWSGGRNIAAEYFTGGPAAPAWDDLSFVVDGALATDACSVFGQDWRLAGGRVEAGQPLSSGPEETGSGSTQPVCTDSIPVQLIPSGPDRADDTVYAFLLTAVYQAQVRIALATPYFVPDDALLQALAIACRRGIRVTLLMPRWSNHRLADWARERALRELAAAGAVIRLSPRMAHAKLVIVDEAVALCGSVNLDGRSLFLNYELTAAFYGSAEIRGFAQWFERQSGQAQSYVLRPPSWPRDIVEGVVRSVAFQL
jgi:cardiolipin synthase